MRRSQLGWGALLGGLTSLALAAIFYVGDQLAGLPFPPFDVFDWLGRALPGPVVTAGIDAIVSVVRAIDVGSTSDAAKTAEQALGIVLFVALGVVAGALIGALVGSTVRRGWLTGGLVGLAVFLLLAAVEWRLGFISGVLDYGWIALLTIGWGALLGALLDRPRAETSEERADVSSGRRRFLGAAGGALAVALVGWLAGRWLQGSQTPTAAQVDDTMAEGEATLADLATPPQQLDGRLEPAPGTRPEVTPDGEFYRIDINSRPVEINGDEWELEVAGLFDNPRNLTLSDLMAFPAVIQPLTLSCISNRIAGDLISTANWTGARLVDVLEDLGLQAEAVELRVEAADGFFESVAMEDMMDPRTLLVYQMNEAPLPTRHGYPLRIYIPNRYGMKQPKWITRIEAIPEEGSGYWVERGWDAEAIPHVVSVIDNVAVDAPTDDGLIPIGGIAWAGDRGIQQVEVQVDDGEWTAAELRTPPLSTLTWVQWRLNWEGSPGEHSFTVRATDGEGTLQTAERTGTRPDGATGYHSVTATVAG